MATGDFSRPSLNERDLFIASEGSASDLLSADEILISAALMEMVHARILPMIETQVQKAIHDALKASPAVAGGRVYDHVPRGAGGAVTADFPFVAIGDEQIIDDGNTCDDGWEVFADLHIWSRAVGYPEAKGLIATIVPRLVGINTVSGFTIIAVEVENTRVFRDPDGLTSHGVISVRFVITPA